MAIKKKVVARKKVKKLVSHARVCINAGLNNTIVTFTDLDGNTLVWSTPSVCGFKGVRSLLPMLLKKQLRMRRKNLEHMELKRLMSW